jgi:putative RNA 2'-phosphotransferase
MERIFWYELGGALVWVTGPSIFSLAVGKASMTARYNPKTLAKTISYIAYQAPAEHGLFWDPDGTMPWKELFWALQEDLSLRFVRESTIREIAYLGLELPFVLEGSLLRLQIGRNLPLYSPTTDVPDRLYFACRRKQSAYLKEHGIEPSRRPYVPISSARELALRLGRRRDPEPLVIEVLAGKAASEGELIRWAGAELYLVEAIPVRYLIFPLVRADHHATLSARKRVEAKPSRPDLPASAGSFLVDQQHLYGHLSAMSGADKTGKQKGKRKSDWKREAKKERHKRSL